MLPGIVQYRVPYADTDQMGFVYYGNYLTYFERSRNELMRANGFTYKELENLGIGLPVLEANVKYHRPAKYDDELTVIATLAEIGNVRLKVSCQVKRGEELLAEGWTQHCFINLQTGRPVRTPEEMLRIFTVE